MWNENLNRLKLHSTRFQRCWTTCSNAPNIWFNKVLNACWSKSSCLVSYLVEQFFTTSRHSSLSFMRASRYFNWMFRSLLMLSKKLNGLLPLLGHWGLRSRTSEIIFSSEAMPSKTCSSLRNQRWYKRKCSLIAWVNECTCRPDFLGVASSCSKFLRRTRGCFPRRL